MKYIISLLTIFLLIGCKTVKTIEKEVYIERIDTLKVPIKIEVPIKLPPDTVTVTKDSLVYVNNNSSKPTVKPWSTETSRSKATAGITEGKPWLELIDKEIDYKLKYDSLLTIYNKTITSTSSKTDTVIIKTPFYKYEWFWVSIVLIVLLAYLVVKLIKTKTS